MPGVHGVTVVLYTPHYAAIAENYVLLSRMLKTAGKHVYLSETVWC